jgi:hypothetical protein
MFRILTVLAAVLGLGLLAGPGACQRAESSRIRSPAARPLAPSILAQPPPRLRLRPPAEAILSDQAVGSPRRAGRDHLSAAEAASEQSDQAAALDEFGGWGWLDGASRSWTTADEVLVVTARDDGAVRAYRYWSREAGQAPYAALSCSVRAAAGLDDCAQGVAGDRVIVVARLGSAVFRISCPTSIAETLVVAQVASLPAVR